MFEGRELMVFYENMLALNNVSMQCEDGKIIGVFGSNSAGKSTLMYALSGIILDIRKRRGDARRRADIAVRQYSLRWRRYLRGEASSPRKDGHCPLSGAKEDLSGKLPVLENLKIGAYLSTKQETKDMMEYVLDLFPD